MTMKSEHLNCAGPSSSSHSGKAKTQTRSIHQGALTITQGLTENMKGVVRTHPTR